MLKVQTQEQMVTYWSCVHQSPIASAGMYTSVCPSHLNPIRAKTVVSYSLVLVPPSKTRLQLDRRTGNLVSSVGNQTQAMFRAIFFPFPNPSWGFPGDVPCTLLSCSLDHFKDCIPKALIVKMYNSPSSLPPNPHLPSPFLTLLG